MCVFGGLEPCVARVELVVKRVHGFVKTWPADEGSRKTSALD